MFPIAYLLLNNLPNQNTLKNLRYFLSQGSNVIGNDGRCQIKLNPIYLEVPFLGNIQINRTRNTLTIQSFSANAIKVQGNLSPTTKVYCLEVGCKYMPRMGESFYFFGIKATIATDTPQNLFLIKNIINRDQFSLTAQPPSHSFQPNEMTIEEQQINYQPHRDNTAYEPTLQLHENMYVYQPTLLCQDALGEQQNVGKHVPPVCSQELLLQQIRQATQREEDFSMPDTIVDKADDAQDKINNHGSKHSNALDSIDMPPTIQQHSNSKIKHTQSYNMDCIRTKSNFQMQQAIEEADNFDDLFGVKQIHSIIRGSLAVAKEQSLKQQKSIQKVESIQQPKSKCKIMVNVYNFKPTFIHKQQLEKQGYQLVSHPDQDYELMLTRQPLKLSNWLLLALIAHKQIQSDQWIFNKNCQITSKLNNIPWKSIYGNKTNYSILLRGMGRFYLTPNAQEILKGVVTAMGGIEVDAIQIKTIKMKIILKAEEEKDLQMYIHQRGAKRRTFYRMEAIIDTVLLGKWVGDDAKYILPS